MSDNNFIECEVCRAKPGSPVLCDEFLRRRAIWDKFERADPLADAIAATCQGNLPGDRPDRAQIDRDSAIDYYRYMIEYALHAPNWADGLSILHDALAGFKPGHDKKPTGQRPTDFDRFIEAVSYTETVDALLDGTIPTRANGEKIYLQERVKLLLEQLEQTADKLSDCWLLMDALARQSTVVEELRAMAKDYLKRQGCPGWKE